MPLGPTQVESSIQCVRRELTIHLAERLDDLERSSGERRSVADSSLAELSPFSAKSVGSEPTLRQTAGKTLNLPQEIPSLDAPSQVTQPNH